MGIAARGIPTGSIPRPSPRRDDAPPHRGCQGQYRPAGRGGQGDDCDPSSLAGIWAELVRRQQTQRCPSTDQQLCAIATIYGQSPDFKDNFDEMHPDLADFFREAVKIYVTNQH